VRITAADDRGGRTTIESTTDAGQPVTAGPVRYTDVTVSGDGQHTVTATATDRAGNTSAASSLPVRIDATAPVSAASVVSRTTTLSATDATSGVDRIEYALDAGPFTAYTGPVPAPDAGRHTIAFRAADKAGNVETARSATVPADLSAPLTGNIGPIGVPTASYTAGWNSVGALNDDADPVDPAQAQIWGTWSGTRPAAQWVQYDWARPIRITGAELKFWRDSDRGTGDGVAEPDGWALQYWDGSAWHDVSGASGYGTSSSAFNKVTFDAVTTSRLRATISADGDGTTYSAVAVTEWRVFADERAAPPVTVTAQSRCVAGKAYVAVNARNEHDAAVDLTVGTAYGNRVFTAVAPGASAYQSFAVRGTAVPAGSVTVRVNGKDPITAGYGALDCQ
jgi:hypothetical protein